jgi:hypothetical protein
LAKRARHRAPIRYQVRKILRDSGDVERMLHQSKLDEQVISQITVIIGYLPT